MRGKDRQAAALGWMGEVSARVAMSLPPAPRYPWADPSLAAFLAASETLLVGAVDRLGVVTAANPAWERWGGTRRLEEALSTRGRARWARAIGRLDGAKGKVVARLRFGPSGAGRRLFRCLLAREGENVWLLGEPVGDVASSVALRAALARTRRQRDVLARTDLLTGLANRRQAERWLTEGVAEAERRGAPLACLMVDIDRFKTVNDTLGHPIGDRVLIEAARVLAEGVRGSDRAARYGGDEFLILLPETSGLDAARVAERLRVQFAGHRIEPLEHALSASIGVASLRPGETPAELLARADAALVRAKRNGRDRIEVDETT